MGRGASAEALRGYDRGYWGTREACHIWAVFGLVCALGGGADGPGARELSGPQAQCRAMSDKAALSDKGA